MFDPKCFELAEYFLPEGSPGSLHDLAQDIQDAVEDFLRTKESLDALFVAEIEKSEK